MTDVYAIWHMFLMFRCNSLHVSEITFDFWTKFHSETLADCGCDHRSILMVPSVRTEGVGNKKIFDFGPMHPKDLSSFVSLFDTIPCEPTQLHHCIYGSSRRKLTRLIHNIPSFHQLCQMCDNNHEHEPWGQKPDGSWATSEETAYPWPLARAIAAQVVLQLQDEGLVCHLPSFAEQECTLQAMRASTNIQPRKNLPPMAPEFNLNKSVTRTHRIPCQSTLDYSALPSGGMSRVPKKAKITKSR